MSYQPAIWQPCYNQSFTSRNLSTSPLTVAGLRGDLYDYKLIVVQYGVGSNALIYFRPNADSGTNYRRYRLNGSDTTLNVEKTDSTYDALIANSSGSNANYSSVFVGEITGKTGAERLVSFIWGNNYGTSYYSQQGYYWWKNTADELTSLYFYGDNVAINFDLIILQKPKLAQDAEWELVERKTLSATNLSNGVWFSGLDGDRDEEYLLKGCFTASSSVSVYAYPNSDNATNYTAIFLRNNAGTANSFNSTTETSFYLGLTAPNINQPFIFESYIKAKSGVYRQAQVSIGGGSASYSSNGLFTEWWRNTADKLENIKLACAATATGHIELYRRGKSVSASKPTFETLKTVDVDGEFSQGYTFDLAGLGIPDADNESMFVLEWHGVSKTSGQTNLSTLATLNGATGGSDYYLQIMYASNSTAAAQGCNSSAFLPTVYANHQYPVFVRAYIFPKSGKYRPALTEYANLFDGGYYITGVAASWWLNTADKLTSIKVYATSANQTLFKGTITLKRLVS